MEKLGVVLDDEKTKTAGSSERCPDCGSELEKNGSSSMPKCPRCGTRPFEKRPVK